MNATLKELGGALWHGVKSALLLRPRAEALDIGLSACVALCALELLGSAAFDLTSLGGAGAFDAGGLAREIATNGVLLALLVWLPFRRVGAHPRRLFAGVLSLSIIVSAVFVPVRLAVGKLSAAATETHSAQLDWIVFAATAGALIWTVAAALRLGFGLAERQHLLSGLALAGTVVVTSLVLPPTSMFPSENDEERSEFSVVQFAANTLKPARAERKTPPPQPRIDVEAAMYRQPGLLGASLDALKPPRDDQAEIYYVGMAPFAGQDVFKRESAAVKALFDGRFGTGGRSIALVNHRDSVETLPLASITNLDVTLSHIGKLMRPEKDVLFLFLTSHGTEGLVSVMFPRFSLNDVTPANLRASLDKAGIRNRVLAISACHSGSFIPALANEDTLILTAARADRTSFGCSNENEWTYFGDAYFNHALKTETSFIDAFEVAKKLITEWETRQKVTPSEPQISIGSAIRDKLAGLKFAAAHPPDNAPPTGSKPPEPPSVDQPSRH
jgi:Peptidase C13 family